MMVAYPVLTFLVSCAKDEINEIIERVAEAVGSGGPSYVTS